MRIYEPVTRIWLCYLSVPVCVALDFASKAWASQLFGGVATVIPGLINIRLVHNRGFLFGFGEPTAAPGNPINPWVYLIPTLACCILFALALATPAKKTKRHLGFACMIGGALGNLLSRFFFGHVVDFLQILFLPIVNLADVFLIGGMALVAVDLLRETSEA